MRRHLPGDRAPAGVAGAVSGDSTHLVAGGDAPRPAGAGGRPFAASDPGSHGLGLPGHADRAVGRSRPGRVYLSGTPGPAARDLGSRDYVLRNPSSRIPPFLLFWGNSQARTVKARSRAIATPPSCAGAWHRRFCTLHSTIRSVAMTQTGYLPDVTSFAACF